MKRILHLTLHKRWFDAIADGSKREEYRAQTEYWRKRLEEKTYDEIHFRNGYNKTSPQMRVEVLGITTGEWQNEPCFVIRLGAVKRVEKDSGRANCDAEAKPAILDPGANGEPQGEHSA